MKPTKYAALIFILFSYFETFAQGGMWTWIHGDSIQSPSGYYGTMGVPDPLNKPASLYEPAYWIDNQDNLWIYGGFQANGSLYEALWKYNPYQNEWTWMNGDTISNQAPVWGIQGVPSPLNSPGARNCPVTWVDASGNLWMYGGYTMGNLTRADLWKFDISINEWAWMSGVTGTSVSNSLVLGVPSSTLNPRSVAETNCSWTDNSNQLWLYGGVQQYWLDYYDDVLRYNISTNEWTWIRGGNISVQPVYGVQGIPDPANNPGSRLAYAKWQDSAGDFFFMNGSTYNFGATDRNDVWRYQSSADEWTWMSGSQLPNDLGNYNAACQTGIPGGRCEDKSAYIDHNEKVWLFGGTTSLANDDFNDLWMYDPVTLQYKLLHGGNLLNQPGNYGQLNVASPANIPRSRDGAILFGDSLCHIFLFGGISRHPGAVTFNDVWKFTPDTSCIPCNLSLPIASFTAPNEICPGTCTDFTNLSSNATSYYWSFPGGNPSVSTDASPTNICYNIPGTYDVTLIAVSANGSDTVTLIDYILVYPNPLAQGISQNGDTLFANAGAVSYQWFYNGVIIPGATDYYYIAPQSGNYNVVATDSNDCEVEAAIFDVIAQIQPADDNNSFSIYPVPVRESLIIEGELPGEKVTVIVICNLVGAEVYQFPITNGGQSQTEINVSNLSAGMYWIEINTSDHVFRTKFIKE